jgi:hypothetical protein
MPLNYLILEISVITISPYGDKYRIIYKSGDSINIWIMMRLCGNTTDC